MSSGKPAGYDPRDPRTWPDATIVVRGGEGRAKMLAKQQDLDGSWSVQSDPAACPGFDVHLVVLEARPDRSGRPA